MKKILGINLTNVQLRAFFNCFIKMLIIKLYTCTLVFFFSFYKVKKVISA